MTPRRLLVTGICLLAFASAWGAGCKRSEPEEGKTVSFSKVPLHVDIPAGWSQTLNTSQWLMYRPDSGGALLAMSGEKSCSKVEKRVYGALLEVGLTEVMWKGSPQGTKINGLHATLAEGHAVDGVEGSRVKYAVVRAPDRRGCLLALVAVWESKEDKLGAAADSIIKSVHTED